MSIALTFILRHHHPQNLQNFIMNSMSSHLDHLSFYIVFRILGRTASAVPFSPPRLQCLWAAGQQSGPARMRWRLMETPPFKVRFSPGKVPLFGTMSLFGGFQESSRLSFISSFISPAEWCFSHLQPYMRQGIGDVLENPSTSIFSLDAWACYGLVVF